MIVRSLGGLRAALLATAGVTIGLPAFAQTAPAPSSSQAPPASLPSSTGDSPTGQSTPAPISQETSPGASTNANNPIAATGSEDVVVTGVRASLQNATNAKRNSVVFGDSIFAEDIGKLPATNLAETLERVPGVRLNRDINGEGVQIAIRGLGPSFSNVLLDSAQIAVASDGGTFGGAITRGVDLDLFPSELFTRLDVQKSSNASTLEGGTAGTVNLRNARPFDKPGTHLTVVAQGQYNDSGSDAGERGALVASTTKGNWGFLAGVAGIHSPERIDGFDTVGWTDGTVAACGTGCKLPSDTGNGFSYASVFPNNVGHGYTPGAPVDLAQTSGLSLAQISDAKIPRLGRNNLVIGDRSRISALGSIEYRPSDNLHFALDGMYAYSKRDFRAIDVNWYVRNSGPGTSPTSTGGMVPIGISVDQNDIVTKGTFANSSFFVSDTGQIGVTKFYNITPEIVWSPFKNVHVDAQANFGHSTFTREEPAFDFLTPSQSGLDVYFDNTNGNPQPIITTNKNLNDPNLGWTWYRLNDQIVKRYTTTNGGHLNVTIGDGQNNIRVGAAYDELTASVRAYDNSSAYQTAVCDSTCDGKTGLIPNSQLAQYLQPLQVSNLGHLAGSPVGITSFIQANVAKIEQATNFASYNTSAPQAIGAVTGGATGDINEKTLGGYAELNGLVEVLDRDLHVNAGVRYFHTDQLVEGPTSTAAGIVDVHQSSSYDDFLPSLNLGFDISRHLKLRAAASRTITRADINSLLPGLTFSDPGAQIASQGNANLQPYTSDNFDFGGEYYTGGIGFIGVDFFRKNINGFTITQQSTVPFTSLGLNFTDLTVTQQQAINLRGGPNTATVTVTEPVNLQNLTLTGIELEWVQPLDFIVKGLGFSANGSHVTQGSGSGLVAPGVAPWSYNLQAFYEAHGISIDVHYDWTDRVIAANAPQNNVNVPLISDYHGQVDVSAQYKLPFLDNKVTATLDLINLNNEAVRTLWGYANATYQVYYPGRQILFGIRANF